jgi:hypothetical protein
MEHFQRGDYPLFYAFFYESIIERRFSDGVDANINLGTIPQEIRREGF